MVEISVVIPVYNTEKYLKECLDSIVNQTFDNIEIICINDGSTDNSLQILEEYEKSDERISIVSQKNSGLSITRNNGIELSNGKYIYFMDSDDYLELNALEELYNISQKNDLDLLIFKLINFNDGSGEKYTSEYYEMDSLTYLDGEVFNYEDIGEEALYFAVSAPGKFFKADLIKDMRFAENMIFEDNLFFAEAMLNAEKVSLYNKHLYNRRIREDSITTSKTIKFADSIKIINMIIDLAKEHDVYEYFKYGLAKKKIEFGFIRYAEVDEEYKEEFFKNVQTDFKNHEEEYEKDILEKLDERFNYIFKSFTSSNNHKELDLRMEIFDIRNNNNYLQNENRKLKKDVKKWEKRNNVILSSRSWKITKPLRSLFNKI